MFSMIFFLFKIKSKASYFVYLLFLRTTSSSVLNPFIVSYFTIYLASSRIYFLFEKKYTNLERSITTLLTNILMYPKFGTVVMNEIVVHYISIFMFDFKCFYPLKFTILLFCARKKLNGMTGKHSKYIHITSIQNKHAILILIS